MSGWGTGDEEGDDLSRLEAANGLDQARRVGELVREAISSTLPFELTVQLVCELQYIAMRGVLPNPGMLRQRSDLEIAGSQHVPPPHEEVLQLLETACAFLNQNHDLDPIRSAAFILWRICWIHPFDDGNGRTARAVAYLILSVRFGLELLGRDPIPARLKYAPIAYTRALEESDAAWAAGRLELIQMERLLAFHLGAQLRDDPPCLPPWV